jgi:hypothetical protein
MLSLFEEQDSTMHKLKEFYTKKVEVLTCPLGLGSTPCSLVNNV